MTPDELSALAAGLSAIATACAAWATWYGPKSAAKLVATQEDERQSRNAKRIIFYTLMQERATIHSTEAVKMLNSIDVVYHDAKSVRDCWAELLIALGDNPYPEQRVRDLTRNLLKAMAENIGLSSELRVDDFGRIYRPTALVEEDYIQAMRRKVTLQDLQRASQKSNTADTSAGPFPPPPDKNN